MSSTQDTGAKVPNNPHFMNFPLYHAIPFNELTFHNKINFYFFIHVDQFLFFYPCQGCERGKNHGIL